MILQKSWQEVYSHCSSRTMNLPVAIVLSQSGGDIQQLDSERLWAIKCKKYTMKCIYTTCIISFFVISSGHIDYLYPIGSGLEDEERERATNKRWLQIMQKNAEPFMPTFTNKNQIGFTIHMYLHQYTWRLCIKDSASISVGLETMHLHWRMSLGDIYTAHRSPAAYVRSMCSRARVDHVTRSHATRDIAHAHMHEINP